jgi:RNA polymerase sigma-70 factor (ECF subfamily)
MVKPTDPDATLMLRVKEGDRAAFETLVNRYKQPVLKLVGRTVRDYDEAEDIAQHVFLQVYKSAHRYKISAKFTTWLFTIARNLALNEIRRRSRHPAESLDAPHPGEEEAPARELQTKDQFSPPEAMLHEELKEKVEEALQALPENQRTAILLCQEGEVSYEEIAKILDCSVSATKSLIHRARETLKAQLKPYLRTGAWNER